MPDGDYLIAAYYDDTYYLLHPSASTDDMYAHAAKVTGEIAHDGTGTPAATTVAITGKAEGSTVARVGNTQYNITVAGFGVDDVVIDFGQSVTYTGLTEEQLDGADHADAEYGDVRVEQTFELLGRSQPDGSKISDQKHDFMKAEYLSASHLPGNQTWMHGRHSF